MGDGRRRLAAVAAIIVGALGIDADRAAADDARGVLGTVRVAGTVEAALEPGGWRPLTGGAVVEGMSIRTGPQATAVLEFANGDVIGLGEDSECAIEAGPAPRAPRVVLRGGRLAVHILGGSETMIATPRADVRGAAASTPSGAGRHEALVAVASGTAVVHAYGGSFEVIGPGDATTRVAAGEVATLTNHAEAPTVTRVAAAPVAPAEQERERKTGWRGPFGWGPWTTGLVATGVVAGGVGVAAAAAGGGGGGGSDAPIRRGSPFRTGDR